MTERIVRHQLLLLLGLLAVGLLPAVGGVVDDVDGAATRKPAPNAVGAVLIVAQDLVPVQPVLLPPRHTNRVALLKRNTSLVCESGS